MCWSPNWNEPQTDSGTPRFGILTFPYPYRFGESPYQYGDSFFCVFFSVTHKIGLFSPNRQQHSKNSSIPIFNARDALGRTPLESARAYASSGRDTPRSSRRALTPRCPPTRQKRRGRGFGCGGGGRLGDLPEPAGARRRRRRHRRRRRRSRRCRVDGRVVGACGGGCLFVPCGEMKEIKKSKKNLFALYGRLPVIQTQQPTKNTRTRRRR